MTSHDSEGKAFKKAGLAAEEAADKAADIPMAAKISSKFSELTADLDDVMQHSSDPKVIGALLFKLAEERERTNRLLEGIAEKYDSIMFEIKTKDLRAGLGEELQQPQRGPVLLPEQDRAILQFVGERGQTTAFDVQSILNYRGLNGASQRLNKLAKEGYLQKVRSGKRVLYLAKA